MPMPNMMMPRSVTVWGTDHKNAPGMKYAQRTTKKTIYVKYRPTNPLSIPIHFIIQKTPFCTPILRITNSKTAIGEKKILCLKKRQSIIYSAVPLLLPVGTPRRHLRKILLMPGMITDACRLRLLTGKISVRAAAPGRLPAALPSRLSAYGRFSVISAAAVLFPINTVLYSLKLIIRLNPSKSIHF